MEELSTTLRSVTTAVVAGVQVLSLLFLLLVAHNFRATVRSRALFFRAVAGDKPAGMFRWCYFLLILYVLVVVSLMLTFDLFYFLRPHLL